MSLSLSLVPRGLRAAGVARGAGASALFEAACVRPFASKKAAKKKGKKGGEDANFEQMLRAIKGQYPDACVSPMGLILTVMRRRGG